MKLLKLKLHIALSFLIVLTLSTAFGQDDSFKFLKRNSKLNRNYVEDLNDLSSSLFVKTGQSAEDMDFRQGKELNILVIPQDENIRFVNPDAIEFQYYYREFNLGDLIPQVFRPVKNKKGNLIRTERRTIKIIP